MLVAIDISKLRNGGGPARPATLNDTTRIRALLSARAPTSNVYATREPGWLPVIDLALQGRPPGGVLVVPQREFLIVARKREEVLHLDDVVGPELPGLDEVLTAIPFRFERRRVEQCDPQIPEYRCSAEALRVHRQPGPSNIHRQDRARLRLPIHHLFGAREQRSLLK